MTELTVNGKAVRSDAVAGYFDPPRKAGAQARRMLVIWVSSSFPEPESRQAILVQSPHKPD